MQCQNHTKFKGLTKLGKRNANCPTCNQIFKLAQEKKKEKFKQEHQYQSLTTPDMRCDLAHLLAEMATIMNFGLQSETFWRKESSTPLEVKEFFFKTLVFIKHWSRSNFIVVNGIKRLLYNVFVKKNLTDEISATKVETKIEESIVEAEKPNLEKSTFNIKTPSKSNIFSFLNKE